MAETTGTLSNIMKTYYHRQLLMRALPNLVHAQACVKVPVPVGVGKVVEFRRWEKLPIVTTPLSSETNPPAETDATVSLVNVTLAEFGQFVKYSKLVQTTGYDDTIAQSAVVLGESMGESLDTITRNILSPATAAPVYTQILPTGITARTGITTTTLISYDMLVRALATLQSNNVKPLLGPAPGRYLAILHPTVLQNLLKDPDVKNMFLYGAQRGETNPFFTGILGHILGLDFVVSSIAPQIASAAIAAGDPGAATFVSLIIGREAASIVEIDDISTDFIFKNIGSAGAADPLSQYGTVAWYSAFNALVTNGAFGVALLSGG